MLCANPGEGGNASNPLRASDFSDQTSLTVLQSFEGGGSALNSVPGIQPSFRSEGLIPRRSDAFYKLSLSLRKAAPLRGARPPDGVCLLLQPTQLLGYPGQPRSSGEKSPASVVAGIHHRPTASSQTFLIEAERERESFPGLPPQ